jgi:hypothetical protein
LGLKRIYINYALDTLVLAEGLHSLKKMLQQYPRIMRRIQWLDISPNRHSWKFSWGDMDPEPMSSLRLVTITLNTGDWREAHPGEWHSVLHNTPPTIQHLDHMFHFGSEPNSSKLGLLFARRPWTNNTVIYDKLGRNFNLMDPSASLRERFEIRLPELWDLEKQPVRDTLDRDWIAYEVEKWS